MIIKKRSVFTGRLNEMDIPITKEIYDKCLEDWKNGKCIQDVFHMLNADEREFILTGCTPEEWDKLFKEE